MMIVSRLAALGFGYMSGRLLAAGLLMWAAVSCAGGSFAAAPRASGSATPAVNPSSVTADDVQAELSRVQDAKNVSTEVIQRAVEQLKQAAAELAEADVWTNKAAAFKTARLRAPQELQAVQAELRRDAAAPDVAEAGAPNPLTASLETLKQALAQAEAAQAAALHEQSELNSKPQTHAERFEEVRSLDALAKMRLDEAERALEATPISETSGPAERAARLLLLARRSQLLAERACYAEELPSYEANRDLWRAQLDLATRRVNHTALAARQWKALVTERCRVDADSKAREARRAVLTARPELAAWAEENQRLAQLRQTPDSAAAKSKQVEHETETIQAERARVANQFLLVKRMTELTDGVGQLLQRQRAELPNLRYHVSRTRARETEVAALKLQLLDLETRRGELADIGTAVRRAVNGLPCPPGPEERVEFEESARKLLETRRDLLDALIGDARRYFHLLVLDLDRAERELVRETEEYSDFISERILWIRSAPPLGVDDLPRLLGALQMLTDVGRWQTVGEVLLDDARRFPVVVLFSVCGLGLWLAVQPRVRRRLKALGVRIGGGCTESIGPTLEALALTTIRATAIPLLLWYLAWRLNTPWNTDPFSQLVGTSLRLVGGAWFTSGWMQQLLRRQGLAEAHFHWPLELVGRLRRNLRWLRAVGLPLMFLTCLLHGQHGEFHDAALGRFTSIPALVCLAIYARRALGHGRSVTSRAAADGPIEWTTAAASILRWAAVAVPLALAGLAAAGYYYTAIDLKWRVQASVWLAVGAFVVRSVLLRWLLVVRCRLAIQQARQQGTETTVRVAGAAWSGELPTHATQGEAGDLDLVSVDAQTRRLLRGVLLLGGLVGLSMIWADVLPAFKFLDHWQLWSYTEMVTDATPVGQPTATPTMMVRRITVRELLAAVLVLVGTAVASRNLPGVLELAWLRRLPLDSGSRYALGALARYTVVFVGVVSAAHCVGIGWGSVQWLAAAMTVGLGFGLQEIFANFVSGLIILFERPMRVGDTVTVGSVSGKVSRIRARATTITDWDNKELIVPNREFITGQLVNWTLSDPVVRLVTRVGVAYGSDPVETARLLHQVAAGNSRVLTQPAPNAILREFGASSLDFELCVYVSGADHLLTVRHELNVEIERVLRRAGIEIAFPQCDVHVRHVPAELSLVRSSLPRAAS